MVPFANPQDDTNALRLVLASGNILLPSVVFANDVTKGLYWDINGLHLTGLATPVNTGDAANKAYVDSAAPTLVAGSNITLTPSGSTLIIASTGGSTITSWAAYTPTLVGVGTPANVSFFWKQVGDSVLVRGTFQSGTSTGVPFTISMPTGKLIDNTKIPSGTADTALVGFAVVGEINPLFADGTDTGHIYVASAALATAGFGKLNGSSIVATGNYMVVQFEVAVQ